MIERRIRMLGIFMVLCFAALFVQLNNIQVIDAHALATNRRNPRVVAAKLDQSRGEILSADGVVLARSVPAPASSAYKYMRTYDPATAALFAQIVGFDSPNYGMTGVEAEYDRYLKVHQAPATNLRDLLVNRTTTDNVTLTIGSHLQQQVAAVLDGLGRGAPEAGAVVVDPRTGAIEAMYSNPTYDPNPLVSPYGATEDAAWHSFTTDPANPMLSRAYQRAYPPGSTFKPVTSSAIYDHMPALATVNYTPKGCITLPQTGGQLLCNYGRNTPTGPEVCGGTIQQALPQSCDTSFARYGMTLGAANLFDESHAFGFDRQIPLDLPWSPLYDSNFPTQATLAGNKASQAKSAFGQENVNATALQMALVAAGIADRGTIMTPHVMAYVSDAQGNLVTRYQPKPWLQATSPQTAASVTALMKNVVDLPIGTAYTVGFPAAEDVAAKTGTAQTGHNTTDDWMIAFAPANNPRVAVAVVVPNQPAGATGNSNAGPAIKKILADALAANP